MSEHMVDTPANDLQPQRGLAMLVIANPSPNSLSHAMAMSAERMLRKSGYAIAAHDLYAERFDPIQPSGEATNTGSSDALVEQHCAEIKRAALILIFHPNWWGQPPAIMKGWIDRVFRLDTAYGYPPGAGFEGEPTGLLTARHAFVFNTSNTPPQREADVFGDPLETLWKHCIFKLCGVTDVTRRMYAPVSGSSAEQRSGWLADVALLVDNVASAI
jgi:NAD(P)H dehydrogenase (quinone)